MTLPQHSCIRRATIISIQLLVIMIQMKVKIKATNIQYFGNRLYDSQIKQQVCRHRSSVPQMKWGGCIVQGTGLHMILGGGAEK